MGTEQDIECNADWACIQVPMPASSSSVNGISSMPDAVAPSPPPPTHRQDQDSEQLLPAAATDASPAGTISAAPGPPSAPTQDTKPTPLQVQRAAQTSRIHGPNHQKNFFGRSRTAIEES